MVHRPPPYDPTATLVPMDIQVSDRPAVWAAARRSPAVCATPVAGAGTASLALSGGSTAPAMIEALLDRSRAVGGGHGVAGRRAGRARRSTPIATPGSWRACRAQVRLMPVTASDLRAAAPRYARSLPERFDVVHLGIGDDGHTASWPPGDPRRSSSARPVESVPPFHGRPRMTLTASVVNAARARVVLAIGAAQATGRRTVAAG